MRPNRKWIKPIWPPQNLKCTFLHSQTRYERNSNGYTYVFGDQLPIGTHENTMRPNRKWIKRIRRPLNLKCMFLHPRRVINEISKVIHMFSGTGYRWDPREYYATKPEVDKTNRAASKLKMHVSPLPDKISAKFQRLYLCFRGPASHWDTRA